MNSDSIQEVRRKILFTIAFSLFVLDALMAGALINRVL